MKIKRVMREIEKALCFTCSVEFWRMAFFWTISLLSSYFRLLFLPSNSFTRSNRSSSAQFNFPSPAPLCVITGPTSGLGEAAAYALSRKGYFVVLAGRSSQSLLKTVERIKRQNKDAQLKPFEVDLSSFHSIFTFKSSLEKWLLDSNLHPSIQLLINNAGVLATSRRLTADGFDQMMGTNYIGAFCMTKLLLPLLRNSPGGSRIVNVTSFTHRSVFDMQVDKETVCGRRFLGSKQYPYAHIYEYSKLCLLLLSYKLHHQFQLMDNSCNVSIVAADPGVVETNIMREVPSCISRMTFLVLKVLGLLQSPENGVRSILDAALAPPETSGVYFFGGNGRTVSPSELSCNIRVAERIWTVSCDIFSELEIAAKREPLLPVRT